MRYWIGFAAVSALLAGGSPALSQPGSGHHQMSAREIFYAAPKAPRRRAPAKTVTPPRVTRPVSHAPRVEPPPESPVDLAARPASPKPVKAPARPAPPIASPPATGTPPEVRVIPAAEVELAPLGIRCSVLKRVGPSDLIEVDPSLVFRSGERIRLRVETNDDGYLYVIHRGSSGVWKPLFPSAKVAGGNNRVVAGRPYDIPPGYVFTFDEQPGEEKLFVVLSRQPVADLEKLIYSLGHSGRPPAPAQAPAKITGGKVLLAENRIDIHDDVVDLLRNAVARDLIIEKVNDSTQEAGYQKESAVYAVTASAESDSRVVVDLNLLHR